MHVFVPVVLSKEKEKDKTYGKVKQIVIKDFFMSFVYKERVK